MSRDLVNKITHEKEITLLICSDRPEELEKDLSSLSEIMGYLLAPASSETIEDEYYDTADRALASRHWALRIRRDRAGQWITLKGPSHVTEWGGLERSELEEGWSRAALRNILTKLHEAKLHHGANVGSFEPANPIETMKSLGFDTIQTRRLQRRRLNVTEQTGGPEIAELDIDDVYYRFASEEILHSEVEIEAKTPAASRTVGELAKELLDRYGPELRIWPYGKLATGRVIERLCRANQLTALMSGNRLKPAAYTIIAEFLRARALQK